MVYLKREGEQIRNGIHVWLGNSSRLGILVRVGGLISYVSWQYRLRFFSYGWDRA